MSSGFVTSQKLHAQTEKVRSKPISWEAYSRAGLMTSSDVQLIQKAASYRPNAANGAAAASGAGADNPADEFLQLYIKLLHDLNRNEAMSYVLVLLADMLDSSVLAPATANPPARQQLYENLEPLVTKSTDDFIRAKSAAILSGLLAADARPPIAPLHHTLSTLLSMLNVSAPEEQWDVENQLTALQAMAQLFKKSEARQHVWNERASYVPALETLLKAVVKAAAKAPAQSSMPASGTATPRSVSGANSGASALASSTALAAAASSAQVDIASPQLQYTLVLALWILTYEPEVASSLNTHYHGFIPLLVELARTAVKEKVVRVVLATFRNLTTLAPDQNLPAMLSAKLLPYLQSVSNSRRWQDEEVKEDASVLKDQLHSLKKGLTTFDEYQQELESGLLKWSTPTHTEDEFWRENAKKLDRDNKKCVKALIQLLNTSQDPVVLAIACNDLAQYVKHVETGRKAVDELGGKTKAMELLAFKDSEVRFYALMAVQRLVSHSWS